jgi:glutaredoxin 3
MKAFVFSIVLILTLTQVSFGQVLESLSDSLTTQKELKKLIVYGSDTCHYCLDTKAYLKKIKIDFIYYDVDVNLLRQREMVIKIKKAGLSLDNLSLPVIEKNGDLLMNSGDFDTFLKRLID